MLLNIWILVGVTIGVIAALWHKEYTLHGLIPLMVVGLIGSMVGGVVAYLFYGSTAGRFDLTVFSFALLFLYCISRFKKDLKKFEKSIEDFFVKGLPTKNSLSEDSKISPTAQIDPSGQSAQISRMYLR